MRIVAALVAILTAQTLLVPSTAFAQSCATMKYGWTKTFGGADFQTGFDVDVGLGGEIYLGGSFYERVDFNPSPKRTDWRESAGEDDGYYVFLDPDGRHRWTGTVGGGSFDACFAVHLSGDRVLFGGDFYGSVDFNPKRKKDIHAGNPLDANAYLSAIGIDRRYHWTRTIESDGRSLLSGTIASDSQGNVISTGFWALRADFNPGRREDIRTNNGSDDVFVWKLDPNGKYVWAHTIGGSNRDEGHDIAVDAEDNVYVAGTFSREVDFDPRGKRDVRVSVGLWDAFLTSLSSKGKVRWSWTVGSTGYDEARGAAIGPDGRVYVTGVINGDADFDARGKGDFRKLQGSADGFLTTFTADGEYLGTHILPGMDGEGQVIPLAMVIDHLREVIAVGGAIKGKVDLDPGPNVVEKTSNGFVDAFVVLLTLEGEYIESFAFGGMDGDRVLDVEFDSDGNVVLSGDFSSTVDFDPGPGEDIHFSLGGADAFLTKLLCGQ